MPFLNDLRFFKLQQETRASHLIAQEEFIILERQFIGMGSGLWCGRFFLGVLHCFLRGMIGLVFKRGWDIYFLHDSKGVCRKVLHIEAKLKHKGNHHSWRSAVQQIEIHYRRGELCLAPLQPFVLWPPVQAAMETPQSSDLTIVFPRSIFCSETFSMGKFGREPRKRDLLAIV